MIPPLGPAPSDSDETTATWDVEGVAVVADWSRGVLPLVHLDGLSLAPSTARQLAAALLAAADRAEAS